MPVTRPPTEEMEGNKRFLPETRCQGKVFRGGYYYRYTLETQIIKKPSPSPDWHRTRFVEDAGINQVQHLSSAARNPAAKTIVVVSTRPSMSLTAAFKASYEAQTD